MTPKRYAVGTRHHNGIGYPGEMIECADGEYVRFEDYEAVAKELSIAQSIINLGEAIEAHRLARRQERVDLIVEILK